jgi:hypothetical protein
MLCYCVRAFSVDRSLNFLPPNTPENLARIVRQAFRQTFEDRQFHEAYKNCSVWSRR